MGRHGLSTVLLATGFVLLCACAGLIGYAQWAEWQHALGQPAGPGEVLAERIDAPAALAAESYVDPGVPPAVGASRTADPAAGPAAWPEELAADLWSDELAEAGGLLAEELVEDGDADVASAAADSAFGRPTWLSIPRIRVDARVAAVKLVGGSYQVPPWDVGYHGDSADPGAAGNAVFNGHLTTINAGRVFARLKELRPSDAVYVYTATHRLDWVVTDVRTVPNTDDGFIDPTEDTRITLYTCAGRWDPRTQDYTHRQVVVAKLVSAAPRS